MSKFKEIFSKIDLSRLKSYLPREDAHPYKKIAFWVATGLIGLFLLFIVLLAGTITVLSIGLPDLGKPETLQAAQSTEIFDKDGKLLYTIHGSENREEIAYKDMTPYLIDATVAIEDDSFWEHSGFDMFAIGKAFLHEVFGVGTARGGSTITQQYVKNAFLSNERSYVRKLKELILAIRLERNYDKEKILELYLNRIPYGNNAYGSQKAAEIYFGKNASDLDLAESVVLASLPQAPTRYNPYGNNKFSHLLKQFTTDELYYRKINGEADLEQDEYVRGLIGQHVDLGNGQKLYVQGRTDLVLKRMQELGKISLEERQTALNKLQTIEFNKYVEKMSAPHFVLYVKQTLEERYGKERLERGGLKVYTTIDSNLQKFAEEKALAYGETNEKNYGTNNLSVLTINAKTGQILTMVGSRDYWNEAIDGNVNVALRPRQPGSSFKPIVYAQAFYNGFGPGSVIYDVPLTLGQNRPQNWDGTFQGQMTIRRALGQSRNIPAIEAYYMAGEQDPIIDLAKKLGITSLNKSHTYGYPLAIGAGEVPLIQMVNAYATFANSGKRPEITGILKVEDADGNIIEEWEQPEFEEVLDPQIAYLINSILSDQSVAVGTRIFVPGKHNAAKTGTSTKESKEGGTKKVRPADGWTIGYTPTIVTGVWAGNTDGTGLAFNADGYNVASPIFQAVMTEALKSLPDEPFEKPEGIKEVAISRASGKLPNANTPADMIVTEIFASFAVPTEQENVFSTVKIDKISGLLATEFTPPEAIEERTFQEYDIPEALSRWAAQIRGYFKGKEGGSPPTEYDNIHTADTASNQPSISITDPASQSRVPNGNLEINVDAEAPLGIARVEFYLDDRREYIASVEPYTGFIQLSRLLKDGSTHLIVAKVIDKMGYSEESAIEIKIDNDND